MGTTIQMNVTKGSGWVKQAQKVTYYFSCPMKSGQKMKLLNFGVGLCVIDYLLRVNGIFEVEDLVRDDGRRLIIVSLESGLWKRSNNSTAFVVNVFADVDVVLFVLGWSERKTNEQVNESKQLYLTLFKIWVPDKGSSKRRCALRGQKFHDVIYRRSLRRLSTSSFWYH